MISHLSIRYLPGKMVQLALYNATTVMNGDTLQIIFLKFLLIMSVTEALVVVEVHVLPALACPIFHKINFSKIYR